MVAPLLLGISFVIYYSNLGWEYLTTIKYGECLDIDPSHEQVASDKKFFCDAKVVQKRRFLGTVREIKNNVFISEQQLFGNDFISGYFDGKHSARTGHTFEDNYNFNPPSVTIIRFGYDLGYGEGFLRGCEDIKGECTSVKEMMREVHNLKQISMFEYSDLLKTVHEAEIFYK